MLDLKRRAPDVRRFVATIEEWIIRTLAAFNVRGERRDDRIGVWVRRPDKGEGYEDKIAAIGSAVRVMREPTADTPTAVSKRRNARRCVALSVVDMLYLWRALSILFEAMHPFKRRNRYQQIARVRQPGKGHKRNTIMRAGSSVNIWACTRSLRASRITRLLGCQLLSCPRTEKITDTRKRETQFGIRSRSNLSGDHVGFRERSLRITGHSGEVLRLGSAAE